jgi:hypothetical protein
VTTAGGGCFRAGVQRNHGLPPTAFGRLCGLDWVLVARTHACGLRCAQSALRGWAVGEAPMRLPGLVLIADAPGRLPHGFASAIGG